MMISGLSTDLEGELLEGIGEPREGLVPGASLGHQRQSASRAVDLTVGDLHAGSLGDVVLEARVGSRSHSPTAGGERTRRISAEGRPRQHCAPGTMEGEEKERIMNPNGLIGEAIEVEGDAEGGEEADGLRKASRCQAAR